MHHPTPTAAHDRLAAALVGSFTADEYIPAGAWGSTPQHRTSALVARLGPGGFFVVSDYEQRDGETVVFTGHGVYGWDEAAGVFTMQWWDSMAPTGGSVVPGRWDGDVLTFERDGQSRYVYEFARDDGYDFAIEARDGGGWRRLMTSRFVRSAGA